MDIIAEGVSKAKSEIDIHIGTDVERQVRHNNSSLLSLF